MYPWSPFPLLLVAPCREGANNHPGGGEFAPTEKSESKNPTRSPGYDLSLCGPRIGPAKRQTSPFPTHNSYAGHLASHAHTPTHQSQLRARSSARQPPVSARLPRPAVMDPADALHVVGGVEVSRNDRRGYRALTLPNGLRTLLISDAEADTCAAALAVGVGSHHDPPELQGAFHFLEVRGGAVAWRWRWLWWWRGGGGGATAAVHPRPPRDVTRQLVCTPSARRLHPVPLARVASSCPRVCCCSLSPDTRRLSQHRLPSPAAPLP